MSTEQALSTPELLWLLGSIARKCRREFNLANCNIHLDLWSYGSGDQIEHELWA